jgi:hypothetical protein
MYDRMPGRSLRSLASSVLSSGKISDFPSPAPADGANSSYTTTIPSPLVSCSQRVIENMSGTGINGTISQMGRFSINHFSVSWSSHDRSSEAANLTVESMESVKLAKVPDQKDSNGEDIWEVLVNKTLLECHPTLAQLVLNVSYVGGIRHIVYVKENVRTFNPNLGSGVRYWTQNNQIRIGNPAYDIWTAKVKEIAQIWNIWAILDAALQALEFKCEENAYYNLIGDSKIPYIDRYCREKGQLQTVAFR